MKSEKLQFLTAFVNSIQKWQGELVKAIEQKQKELEKQAEDQINLLEQDLSDVRRRRCEIEQLIQSEDYLYVQQNSTSKLTPESTNSTDPISDSTFHLTQDISDVGQRLYVEMVKNSVAQIEETLGKKMEMLIQQVWSSDSCDATEQSHAAENTTDCYFIPEVWSLPQDELMKIQQCSAVNMTLDLYTANHWLMVSDDEKRLSLRRRQQFFPSFFARPFKYQPFVLAKEGFSSGRFYFEVRVSGSPSWLLGVVTESFDRETNSFPTPQDGAWIFYTPNSMFLNPLQTVGVFVDYEEGKVSLYDVEARCLIWSFTEGTFMQTTALRSFLYSFSGVSSHYRPKLYPIFGICSYDYCGDNLVITPVTKP